MIEETVQATLAAASGVTAHVPVDRIKVSGNWQNLALPYIVHAAVSMTPTRTHDGGLESLRKWDAYQVDTFAATYSQARTIAEAVVTALDGTHGGVQFSLSDIRPMGKDPEIPYAERVSVEFEAFE